MKQMLLFLPYKTAFRNKLTMEHLHSSIGEQKKINQQQLSRILRSTRYREPFMSELVHYGL